jgi:hypothetical protein
LEFRSQTTPPENVSGAAASGMLAIASFIIHYLGWQGQDVLGPSFVRVPDYTDGTSRLRAHSRRGPPEAECRNGGVVITLPAD